MHTLGEWKSLHVLHVLAMAHKLLMGWLQAAATVCAIISRFHNFVRVLVEKREAKQVAATAAAAHRFVTGSSLPARSWVCALSITPASSRSLHSQAAALTVLLLAARHQLALGVWA